MLRHHRPSPALLLALLALLVALGGTSAVAAPAVKRLIDGRTIEKGSLPGDRVKRGSLGGAQIDERKLGRVPRATLAERSTSADRARAAATADRAAVADRAVRSDSAGRSDSAAVADRAVHADSSAVAARAAVADALSSEGPLALVRAPATAAADEDAALAAAPELPLGGRGPFTLYAKCVIVDGQPLAFVLVRTSREGTLLSSSVANAVVGPASPERERVLQAAAPPASFAAAPGTSTTAYTLVEPGGAVARGTVLAYVSADGAAGPLRGDERCLVSGTIGS